MAEADEDNAENEEEGNKVGSGNGKGVRKLAHTRVDPKIFKEFKNAK